MHGNWGAALAFVLKHEGGYVDHPNDPGGATNLGITIGTLSDWLGRPATKADVKALTRATVEPIYKRNYWEAVSAAVLKSGVDLVAFDAAVNSGPKRSKQWLQRAAGVAADGVLGPATFAALQAASARDIVIRATEARLGFLQGLTNWKVFGKGWGRRVGEVRALGLAWAGATPEQIEADAGEIESASRRDAGSATATGTAGGTAGGAAVGGVADKGADVQALPELDWSVLVAVGITGAILIVIAIVLMRRSNARKEMASAARDVASDERLSLPERNG